MDIEERVNKLENRMERIEVEIHSSIPEIQAGIREIKVLLQERPVQEDLKNKVLEDKIQVNDSRLKKLEDNQTWLWRTVAVSLIGLIIQAIVFVIKMM